MNYLNNFVNKILNFVNYLQYFCKLQFSQLTCKLRFDGIGRERSHILDGSIQEDDIDDIITDMALPLQLQKKSNSRPRAIKEQLSWWPLVCHVIRRPRSRTESKSTRKWPVSVGKQWAVGCFWGHWPVNSCFPWNVYATAGDYLIDVAQI